MGSEMSCPCTSRQIYSDEPTPNPNVVTEMEKHLITPNQIIHGKYLIITHSSH